MNSVCRAAVWLLLVTVFASSAAGQFRKGKTRNAPPDNDGRAPQATPVEQIKVLKDFRVELLYSVPREEGSWVSMCTDDKGRLIVSDQADAGLFRVTPPPTDTLTRSASEGGASNTKDVGPTAGSPQPKVE